MCADVCVVIHVCAGISQCSSTGTQKLQCKYLLVHVCLGKLFLFAKMLDILTTRGEKSIRIYNFVS